MVKNKFLSFDGLKKYDKLIKSYIALSNRSLEESIDTLTVDIANLKAIDHEAYISADATLEETLKKYTDGEVAKKQDTIEDLDAIREGAALGKTALQEVPATYVTEEKLATQVEDLIDDVVVSVSNEDIDNLFEFK